MVRLVETVYRVFPQCSYDVGEDLKPFYQFRHNIHVVGGVVYYKDRVIIPAALRNQVLDAIHAAHQGVSGMVSRVEDSVCWPGITPNIMRTRGGCMSASCTTNSIFPIPVCGGGLILPGWQELFGAGRQLLRLAHYLQGWCGVV
jgi:hypothetical protein